MCPAFRETPVALESGFPWQGRALLKLHREGVKSLDATLLIGVGYLLTNHGYVLGYKLTLMWQRVPVAKTNYQPEISRLFLWIRSRKSPFGMVAKTSQSVSTRSHLTSVCRLPLGPLGSSSTQYRRTPEIVLASPPGTNRATSGPL